VKRPWRSPLLRPLDLEFEFLFAVFALVLDAVGRADRHVDAFASNLDFEPLAILDGVCQTTQLGDEFREGDTTSPDRGQLRVQRFCSWVDSNYVEPPRRGRQRSLEP
jgi:hypothetical protein